ncbi:PucR family transcriptional regulator [Eubacterium oxidoreducens]|uniref:PucR C-terminal helix-turn-helix domain-containing protein n=1 Tax=Eubacterium oxidoreducens TaxID=1732 RepID=A0A1G6C720_EUBOX|nr:helix-turn-helix domain-containing protein [Eubacterium oxidoreducens]SDB28611.1 PucR C-terminal helix-turn-helix domain-containing protein [Eubacterium oxidoreducens]
MTTLNVLLNALNEHHISYFHQPYDKQRPVYQISHLTENSLPDSHTLFLLSSHRLSKSLQQMLADADKPLMILDLAHHRSLPFPAICLSNDVDTSHIYQILNDVLSLETTIQSEIQSMYALMLKGDGLDSLTDYAEQILGHPISILDTSYAIIAASSGMRKLSFGLDDSSDGLFLSIEEIQSLRRLQIEEKIYTFTEAFFVNTEDHPETNWIFSAIRIHHVMSGYVAVCLPSTANATSRELRLTTALSQICSIEMQKHDFFSEQTGLQYETFLTDLLDGRFGNLQRIHARLKLLNQQLGSYYCLALFDRLSPSGSDFFNKQQLRRLRNLFPGSMSIAYQDIIVLFIHTKQPIFLDHDFTSPVIEYASRNSLRVAFSQPFADLLKTHIFFRQAHTTLQLCEQAPGNHHVGYSVDALPYVLFSNTDNTALEAGIHYHLYHLQDYDAIYHTEFVKTLRAYLQNDRNMANAAKALHIHRSTFFYRIKKIEELLDISISDSHLLFLYELSFKLWDYLLHI